MSVRTYNPSVRVGNWNEDIQLEEDTLKDFLERRDKGQLLYQKRTQFEQTIFKKIDLTISRDGFVHFGDIVNIRCPGTKDKTKYFAHLEPRQDCQLSVYPEINRILEANKFEEPCGITGARDLTPNLRSCFVIRSCDGSKNSEPLRYGQPFFISTLEGEGGNLLLQSDRANLTKSVNKSRHQDVSLVLNPSFLVEWQVLHFDPRLRMEYEGIPVPANERVIINHRKTNQNLAVEDEFTIRTPFGSREYEITSHTYLDSHRAEKEVNHWMIIMGVPGDPVYPVMQSEATRTTSSKSATMTTERTQASC
ncbi:hypothetical protein ACJMK2_043981 [Sinanodonta woodiana]|uniref:Cilia- and flagella-associated protein 161 n=1 Tax=Sinanodonta woodiana TaxID=1069815 RepID=A0ABD3VZD6_SINWO